MGAIYTTILHDVRQQLGISNNEYVLLDTIQKLSRETGCNANTEYLAQCVGITRRSVQRSLVRLIQEGLLSQRAGYLKVSDKWSSLAISGDKKSPINDKRSPKSDKKSSVTDAIIIDNKSNNKVLENQLLQLNQKLGRTSNIIVNPKRLGHLKQRLAHFTFEQLAAAAEAIKANDFMREGGHNNIDYLIRNDEKVEQWLNKAPQKRMITVEGRQMESPF